MDFQHGILVKNCKILKLSTKVQESVQAGVLIYIFKEVHNNYIIQLFLNDHNQEFYACQNDVVCKLLERIFNLILPIDTNKLRIEILHKTEFMQFIAKISVDEEFYLNGKLFGKSENTILKSKIKYIGVVPEMGVGSFIGIEFVTSHIPPISQQNFLARYIKNCSKTMGILISVEMLEKYIVCNEFNEPLLQNYTTAKCLTEPSLFDNLEPNDFDIVSNKDEDFDEIERNKNEFGKRKSPIEYISTCASNVQNLADVKDTRKQLNKFEKELNINGLYENFTENNADSLLITDLENQISQLKLRNTKKTSTPDCGICRSTCTDTATLKDCRHNFCLRCIAKYSDDNLADQVVCPYQIGGLCKNILSVNEKNDLVTKFISQKYSENILKEAIKLSVSYNFEINNKPTQKFAGSFYCKVENCNGCWFINENDERYLFICPVCLKNNCLRCNAIHDMNSDFPCEENKQQPETSVKKQSKNVALKITCLYCLENVAINNSIAVNECKHTLCKSCVTSLVRSIVSSDIQCLYQDDNSLRCQSIIYDNQLNLIVSENIFKQYKLRKLKHKLSNTPNSVRCKTPDCYGWAINEGVNRTFNCPECAEINCFVCEIIHKNIPCEEYQRNIIRSEDNDNEIKVMIMKKLTQEEIDEHLLTEVQAINDIKISNENKDNNDDIANIFAGAKQSDNQDDNDDINDIFATSKQSDSQDDNNDIDDIYAATEQSDNQDENDDIYAAAKQSDNQDENENDDINDIYAAAKQSEELDNILKVLKSISNCELCGKTNFCNKITEMIYCNHYCCNDCTTSYFRQRVIECTVIDLVCPVCKAPDLLAENNSNGEAFTNYFAKLDPILKELLEKNHYEIFKEKVRDHALMQDINLKLCAKSENISTVSEDNVDFEKNDKPLDIQSDTAWEAIDGIYKCKTLNCSGVWFNLENAAVVKCPVCKVYNCIDCQSIHTGKTCIQYKTGVINQNYWKCDLCDVWNIHTQDLCTACFHKKNPDIWYCMHCNCGNCNLNIDQCEYCKKQRCTIEVEERCSLCFKSTDGLVISAECGHYICLVCLNKHVVPNRINKCKAKNCQQNLSADIVKLILSDAEFEKYNKMLDHHMFKNIRNGFFCTMPNCTGFWIIDDNNIESDYRCPICAEINCISCNAIHKMKSCTTFQNYIEENSQSSTVQLSRIEKTWVKLRKENHFIQCQKCMTYIFNSKQFDNLFCGVCKEYVKKPYPRFKKKFIAQIENLN